MSAIVLTNWDPSCYYDASGDELLIHMVAVALRSSRVLIRDQDLCFNRQIARLFVASRLGPNRHEIYRRLLEELFETNIYRVKLMRPEHFRDEALAELSQKRPIRARALYIQRHNLYVPLPSEPAFNPDDEPFKSFHDIMDGLLSRYEKAREYLAEDSQIPDKFKAELTAVANKCTSQLKRHWRFGTITGEKLNDLAELMTNYDSATEYLRNAGSDVPPISAPRRLLYEIVKTGKYAQERSQLEALAQSIFSAVYAENENAEAVYNDLLSEPPLPSIQVPSGAELHPRKLIFRTIGKLELRPGIGSALEEVRKGPTKNGIGLIAVEDTFDEGFLRSSWEYYCEIMARKYSKFYTTEPAIVAQTRIYIDKVTGWVLAFATMINEPKLAKGATALKGIATLAGMMSRFWGGAAARRRLSEELRAAFQQRCHRVRLLSGRGESASGAA